MRRHREYFQRASDHLKTAWRGLWERPPSPPPTPRPPPAPCSTDRISVGRVALTVPRIKNHVRILQVSPRGSPTTVTPEAADAQLRRILSAVAAEPTDRGVDLHDSPLVMVMPELYANPSVLVEGLAALSEGTVVISGLRGERLWTSGREAKTLLRSASRLTLDDEARCTLETSSDADNLNLVFVGTVYNGSVQFTVRPKVIPAAIERSSDPAATIRSGHRLLVVELRPPEPEQSDGMTILPLICSEYFGHHDESRQTVVDAVRARDAGLAWDEHIDLITVSNLCEAKQTGTTWPEQFEDAFDRFHGDGGPYRSALALSALTCPSHCDNAATGLVGNSSLWGSRQSRRIVAPSTFMCFREDGSWQVPSESKAPDRASLLFSGIVNRGDPEAVCEFLTYRYMIPRYHVSNRHRQPVELLRMLQLAENGLSYVSE